MEEVLLSGIRYRGVFAVASDTQSKRLACRSVEVCPSEQPGTVCEWVRGVDLPSLGGEPQGSRGYADGGRGFGLTGGHFHKGWGNDDQRKLVLNAIVWSAKAEVPANGIESKVTPEELAANLDPKAKK